MQSPKSLRRSPARALALACLLLALGAFAPAVAGAEPKLTMLAGSVEIGRGEPPTWSAAQEGELLGAGDAVRTGRGARAEIDLGTGVVRLYENSLLRVPADAMRPEGAAAAAMEQGSSLFDVKPRNPRDPFEVRTPEVVASVKGTRFAVQTGSMASAVSVYHGLVGVRGASANAREVMVKAGFAAVGGSEHPLELQLLRHDDPWSAWGSGSAAPTPPIPLGAPTASPSSDGGAASHGADVDSARDAALRASAPEVLQAVNERAPEDRGKVAKALKERDVSTVPAALDEPQGVDRTPLDKLEQRDAKRELEERVTESMLNGTAEGSLTKLPTGVDVSVVTSGGPNQVLITLPNGVTSTLTEDQVEKILETGNTSLLPAPVLGLLQTSGVSPMTFTQQLKGLLH